MIVEVIAVGTELLIGQIVNSNAAAIGARLADEGFDAHYQVTVGDNLARLADAIRTASGRADAVILTGGIGPTQDDLTREAICAVTGRGMARDTEHAEHIRRRLLATRGFVVENVLRMADHPEGAETLPNANGVALGVAIDHQGVPIFAMPGVPREMTAMLDAEVLPRLRARAGEPTVLRSRVLHTWGHGESTISDMLDDLYASSNPSIAFLIKEMEVRIRITAKAATPDEADALIAPVEAVVRDRLGTAVFGTDGETNLGILARHLSDRRWAIGSCEVATCGEVVSGLAGQHPEVVAGGMVLPSDPSGALELARRAIDRFGADVGLGVEAPIDDDDGGRSSTSVRVGVVTPDGARIRTLRLLGSGERARAYAVIGAGHLARLAVTGEWWAED
jgi:nicotinamide-nucleotide amidase